MTRRGNFLPIYLFTLFQSHSPAIFFQEKQNQLKENRMVFLYYYSAILYKLFHFSKSFRYFFSKSIVFLSFSSILQQMMAAPPFPEGWRMTQESLSDPLPPGTARGVFFSSRLVLFPDLSSPHEMKAAAERFFFLC